jgi:phosphoglycolate phosphatase
LTDLPSPVAVAFAPSRVRGIVFDLDGTLVDSYDAIADAANHALDSLGIAPRPVEEIRRLVGRGLEDLLGHWIDEVRLEPAVRAFRKRYAEICLAKTRLLPRVAPSLRRLREAGLPLAVASNKPARFGERILDGFGLLELFACVQGPDRAGSTKPEPTMIRECLRAMELHPGAGLYVGDMLLDIESGSRAGVPVVLVRGGSSGDDELDRSDAPVVADLAELADRLT